MMAFVAIQGLIDDSTLEPSHADVQEDVLGMKMSVESIIETLEKCIPPFPSKFVLKPDFGIARIVDIYDGDTVTCIFLVNGRLCKESVRLRGIDAPEIRSKTNKEAAIAVRDHLRTLCLNKCVCLQDVSEDKYGRMLANIRLDDIDVSEYLLNRGLVKAYDGGHKSEFTAEALDEIIELANGD